MGNGMHVARPSPQAPIRNLSTVQVGEVFEPISNADCAPTGRFYLPVCDRRLSRPSPLHKSATRLALDIDSGVLREFDASMSVKVYPAAKLALV